MNSFKERCSLTSSEFHVNNDKAELFHSKKNIIYSDEKSNNFKNLLLNSNMKTNQSPKIISGNLRQESNFFI